MKFKRLAALGLTAALSLSLLAVPAGAVTFTDISGHWAKSYIEDMVKKGLVTGYGDGTYRPNKTLSVAEGLAFCARALQVDEKTAKAVQEKHADYLDEMLNDQFSWFRKEFALCLESGIVSKAEFKTMVQSGVLNSGAAMEKQDLARYMVRAMGLDLLAENQENCPLGFGDAQDIREDNRKSVYLLNMYGIITGDQANNFNSEVNRAIMATMLSRVISFKTERGIVTELPDFTTYQWAAGTLQAVNTSDRGLTVLTLDDGLGEEMQAVPLTLSAKIYENNMETNEKALQIGTYVRVALDEKGNGTKAVLCGELESVSGTVVSLTRESALLSLGGAPKTVALDRFTLVQAGDRTYTVDQMDLNGGYTSARAMVDGRGKAVSLQLLGGTTKRTGVFVGRESIVNSDDILLNIVGYDGVPQRYTMPDDVTILVNGVKGKNSAMSGYKGRLVTLRVSNETGLVTSVDFDTAVTCIQGSLRSFVWQTSSPSVGIYNLETGRSVNYNLSKNVSVTYEGKSVEYRDVKKDWFVTARQVGGEVVEMDCYPATATAEGTITVDYSKVPLVLLTVESEDGVISSFELDVDDLPVIRRDDKTSSIDKLKNGDRAVVTIKYNEVTLIEAASPTTNLLGTVQSVFQTMTGDSLVVKLSSGEEMTYQVTAGTSITKDGRAVAFSSLKPGYQISLLADGNRLTAIEVDSATAAVGNSVQGTVIYVNTTDKTILFQETGSENIITVSTASVKTILSPSTGEELKLKDLRAGDTLSIYGTYNGLTLSATTILR